MKKVAIIMGSDSDWPVVKSACTVLKEFGVPYEAHILSAHRTPEEAAAFTAALDKLYTASKEESRAGFPHFQKMAGGEADDAEE